MTTLLVSPLLKDDRVLHCPEKSQACHKKHLNIILLPTFFGMLLYVHMCFHLAKQLPNSQTSGIWRLSGN